MTELSASDAAYSLRDKETNLLQHADNDGYNVSFIPLIFLLWPIHSEIFFRRKYFVLNRLFLKVGAWNKSFLFHWFLLMTAVLIF